jgi:hypothetical protein
MPETPNEPTNTGAKLVQGQVMLQSAVVALAY